MSFFLTLYYSINDMNFSRTVCVTPQPCHIHFVVDCCQFGPSWSFGLKMELMACAGLAGGTTEQSCIFLILYYGINDMKLFLTV